MVINYVYDIEGNRISNTWNSGNTGYSYVYGVNGQTELRNKISSGSVAEVIHNIYGNDLVETCTVTSTSSEKNYFLKDHLGSIKVIVNEDGSVSSYTDYDPFGLQLENRYTVNNEERYKFTGKERDEETSYDYFGARYYDSRIARWLQVDPLAEKYAGWSTYNYTMNNPLKYVDMLGMDLDDYKLNQNGDVELVKKTNDNYDRLFKTDDNNNAIGEPLVVSDNIIDNITQSEDQNGRPFEYMEVSDNNEAKNLFEFCAENSKVEWSHVKYDNSNYIATSKIADKNYSGIALAWNLMKEGIVVSELIHSHPYSLTRGDNGPSKGDVEGAKAWKENAKIFSNIKNMKLSVYNTTTMTYIPYSK